MSENKELYVFGENSVIFKDNFLFITNYFKGWTVKIF